MKPTDPKFIDFVVNSVNKHFTDNRGDYQIRFEGQTPPEESTKPSFFEVRINGPRWKEISRNCYRVYMEVSLLCSSVISENAFKHMSMTSHLSSKMDKIELRRFAENENGSLIGCFLLRPDVPYPIDVIPWGQPDPTTKVMLASVEGYYHLQL
jgi:hypothetical protein